MGRGDRNRWVEGRRGFRGHVSGGGASGRGRATHVDDFTTIIFTFFSDPLVPVRVGVDSNLKGRVDWRRAIDGGAAHFQLVAASQVPFRIGPQQGQGKEGKHSLCPLLPWYAAGEISEKRVAIPSF